MIIINRRMRCEDSFVQIARVVSAIFLASQIVSFIDAAFHWNHFFVGDDPSQCKIKVLLTICGCFISIAFVGLSNVLILITFDQLS